MITACSALWPAVGADPLVWWGLLAGKLGADPALPRPFLICLRGVGKFEPQTHALVAKPGYPDTGVLVYRGGVRVFSMSSLPYQVRSTESPNVDAGAPTDVHDGSGDVACIKTGRYVLTDKGIQPCPVFVVTMPDGSGTIPCSRDLKHNGDIDHEGPAIYGAEAILVHTGRDGAILKPPSGHTWSIGCQTMALPDLEFMRAIVSAKGAGVVDYVLINAAPDALALVATFPPFDDEPTNPIGVG